jgi:hypothetical protein
MVQLTRLTRVPHMLFHTYCGSSLKTDEQEALHIQISNRSEHFSYFLARMTMFTRF